MFNFDDGHRRFHEFAKMILSQYHAPHYRIEVTANTPIKKESILNTHKMTKGQVEEAERIALNRLDKWNDVAGVLEKHTGYYYEAKGVVLEAVTIGIQMALHGAVHFDGDGNVMPLYCRLSPKEAWQLLGEIRKNSTQCP